MSAEYRPERIVVLGGGTSPERAVSLASSRAVHAALKDMYACEWVDLTEEALPDRLDPTQDVIFPVLHGTFGEDGALQRLLELEGFVYAGCDSLASARCIDKVRTKALVGPAGVPVAPHLSFTPDEAPMWETVVDALKATSVVLKPVSQGSSVGLYFIASSQQWAARVNDLEEGLWIVEPHLRGHDVTVGVLAGEALGVIGIFPAEGAPYDYVHKYTAGKTRYEVPAQMPLALSEAMRRAAVEAFAAVGARDFARVDFIREGDRFTFLEINTIPGMTETSLLPKSASVCGISFSALVERMLAPALSRFRCREELPHG